MNSFEKHDIEHLSASSLNIFAAEPALWVMERLLDKRAPVGCAAHRGTAIEHGVQMALLGSASVDGAQQAAYIKYDLLTAFAADPARQKERDAIAGCVEQAIDSLAVLGIPDRVQEKISIELEGIPVPFIGFLDFAWSEHGIVIDLKTQLRLSSGISAGHARQISGYVHGTNSEGRVLYVTPKKWGSYTIETPQLHVDALTNIAHRLGRFLATSDDPQELASMVCPDYDSFYWNNPVARAMGKEVYGF